MGLGRRACKPTWVILEIDPSVLPGSDYAAYAESMFTDRSKLELDPEDPPTEFLLRQLTPAQRQAIEEQSTELAKYELRVRCALRGVKNYLVVNADGTDDTVSAPAFRKTGKLGEIVERRWFEDALRLNGEQLVHLSLTASALSEASLPFSERSSPAPGPPESESKESSGE